MAPQPDSPRSVAPGQQIRLEVIQLVHRNALPAQEKLADSDQTGDQQKQQSLEVQTEQGGHPTSDIAILTPAALAAHSQPDSLADDHASSVAAPRAVSRVAQLFHKDLHVVLEREEQN